MNVVAYSRVSTEVRAASGQSINAKRAKALANAALYDLELVEII